MANNHFFEKEHSFQDLVKSAKRKSLKRTIIVSIVVTLSVIVILWGLAAAGAYVMYNKMDEQTTEASIIYAVKGANTTAVGTNYDYFFLAGTTNTGVLKMIGTIPFQWDEKKYWYTAVGMPQLYDEDHIFSNNHTQFFKNSQRILNFLPPSKAETNDDKDLFYQLSSNTLVEVGLSFQKEIPLNEIAAAFPSHLNWVWVLGKEKESDQPFMLGEDVFGFEVTQRNLQQDAEFFLKQLEYLSNVQKNEEVKSYYATWPSHNIEEMKGSGVVLTGTVEQLKPYITQEIVKHVSVGVIIPQ